MDRGEAGAVALETILQKMGIACERRYDSIRLDDSGTIIYFQESGDEDDDAEGGSLCYRALTYIPRIDRTFFDIALGLAVNDRNPFETAAEAYISSVLPIVHALTTDHVDCMGVASETLYSKDAETGLPLEWKLLLGPLRTIDLPIQPDDKRRFADAIADFCEPMLTQPGVYLIKCMAYKAGNVRVEADCFVNNRPLVEGKRRFLEIAESLTGDADFLMRKQILAIVPADLDEAIAERDARRRSQWLAAVESHAPDLDAEMRDKVFLGIEAMTALERCPPSSFERRLIENGCAQLDACRLPTFLASACAQLRWKQQGITWVDRYVLVNYDTQKGHVGSMLNDPLFQAAMRVVDAFHHSDIAKDAIESMLAFSGEHQGLMRLQSQGVSLSTVKLKSLTIPTEEEIDGELDAATLAEIGLAMQEATEETASMAKPWWKFW